MTRSPSASECAESVWSRLATRLRCVSMTPLGNPVVPLEYGSTATSAAGSIDTRGTGASCSSRAANGAAPGALPITKTSSMLSSCATGPARSMNGGTVTRNRARASRSWNTASCTVQRELIVVTTPPAASGPWKASANSGALGMHTPSTSPGREPAPASPSPRPGTPPPEAGRPSGAGHVQSGKRQGVAAPVRDRPVLGRDPRGSTRHRSARARLSRLAGEARGRARSGDRGGAGAGQAARPRRRVRGAPEGHQSPGRRRARGAREPAPRRHRAARPHGAPALDALRRDAVALECVGNGQGRPRGAGGRAAVLRGQGPEGSLRPDGESSDRARDRRSAAHMAPAMRARALLVLAGVAAAAPPGAAQTGATRQKSETAVFAGGCFWGVDAVFRHVRGGMAVVSGYAGGGAAP